MLTNKTNIHPLGYDQQYYHGQVINYLDLNEKAFNTEEKISLQLCAYIDRLLHIEIEIKVIFESYKKALELIPTKYIKALEYLIEKSKNPLDNLISQEEIDLMTKVEELKKLYTKSINTIEAVEYFELLSDDKENLKISKNLINNLIDIKHTLEASKLETYEFIEAVEEFCNEIDRIKDEIEYLAIRHFTHLVESGYNQVAAALCIGSEFLKDVSELIRFEATNEIIEPYKVREYKLESLCSLEYHFIFSDITDETEAPLDSRVADLVLM